MYIYSFIGKYLKFIFQLFTYDFFLIFFFKLAIELYIIELYIKKNLIYIYII